MQQFEEILEEFEFSLLPGSHTPEQTLFFDIETTGLSADTSYIYLIGIIRRRNHQLVLTQWFSNGPEEEEGLIEKFAEIVSGFSLLVHYNGNSFDLPFLQKKVQQYQLDVSFTTFYSLDVYKELRPLKKLLDLKSLKQRSVEEFLGFYRKDPFSGIELLEFYIQYVGRKRYESLCSQPARKNHPDTSFAVPPGSGLPVLPSTDAKTLLSVLLLHNKEDLIGLLSCIKLLRYLEFFQGGYQIAEAELINQIIYLKLKPEQALPCDLAITIPLPADKNVSPLYGQLLISKQETILKLPCVFSELNYYFPNYKDYYYLPQEETAVHKSVAQFVDPNYRKKATKETAFQKKHGFFLPQKEVMFTPEFKVAWRNKVSFFEVTNDFLNDRQKLYRYVQSLFSELFS